jgi:predicted unusual protein kinase regulating ubiquinone biosynthesis (AarF/ABC1/UbiB family)
LSCGFGAATVLGALGVLVAMPRVRRVLFRWLTVLRLSGRAAASAAAHQVHRFTVAADRRGDLDVAFQLRTAGDVAATLGGMKGVFMKVGQLASFVDDAMPEHVRTALAQLQDSAPPMAPELAASVVRAELGAPPEVIFRTWDPTPLAAASIGQVHRAVLQDGTAVAVKVQYPGIDKTMEADLAQLELGRLVVPLMGPRMDYRAMTTEVRARLSEELDYTIEAANQRQFSDWYEGHPFIHIPRVIDELSTKRVLTSTLGTGMRFAQLEKAPQPDRDLAAEVIFRFVHRSIHDHLTFNGDPHPGNYLFDGSGVVTFLDFGLVKHLTPRALDLTMAHAHAAAIEPDPARSRALVEEAGYYVPGAPLTDHQMFSFDQMFWSYLIDDGPVTLTAEWASDTVRRYFFQGRRNPGDQPLEHHPRRLPDPSAHHHRALRHPRSTQRHRQLAAHPHRAVVGWPSSNSVGRTRSRLARQAPPSRRCRQLAASGPP